IAVQHGLLSKQPDGRYGFLHLTFQEHFAAAAAVDMGASGVTELAGYRHDPWWEEVIVLLASRMVDASPLLLALLGHDQEAPEPLGRTTALAADDDILQGGLFLTAQCRTG